MTAHYELQGDIAVVTMDDGKANAISHAMLEALHGALDKAEAEAKAVVITGREGRFSAGFDLKYFASATPEDALGLVNRGGVLAQRLYGLPMPVIAACNGHAIAMGSFILLSCDTRIGVEGDFKIGANETAINMVLPVFAAELLKARLDPRRLTEAGVQARLYDPRGAAEVGYLDEAVLSANLMDEAMTAARQLAALPTATYGAQKRLLRGPVLAAMDASLTR